jgi:uncharacterized membrane protein YcaP (DUF421 family)
MKSEDIDITDWVRILVGEVPATFYIELVIRAAFVYLLLMVSMRLMGKRMSSQLGRHELTAMVTLAAAIGIPLQSPDRGLIPAVIIAMVVIFVGRWIANKSFHDQKFEQFSQGNIDMLVRDSVLDLKTMKKVRISRERLVAQLRSSGITHLGKVKRLYIEASGGFTIIREENPKPGLSILPRWDDEFNSRFKKSDTLLACQTCGTTLHKPSDEQVVCPNCKDNSWVAAVE